MNSLAAAGTTTRASLYLVAGVVTAWLATYADALVSAARVWWVSEIYSHCFFILPASAFLIWRERHRLAAVEARSSPWVAIPLALVSLLGVLGAAGGIDVLTHVAAFAALPLAVWLVVGTRAARRIWFPLAFVLFSVPVGDQLVPYLQVSTADMAVALLQWTGVPVFRDGMFIDIPNGRFIVAEACSGVSFLVVSVAFGAFFAYVSYRHWPRRLAFMAFAFVLPIVANGLRVYGLILIGHLSNMRYATGVDHIVYGWVFFSFVLICLIAAGNRFADRDLLRADAAPGGDAFEFAWPMQRLWAGAALAITILALSGAWRVSVAGPVAMQQVASPGAGAVVDEGDWRPLLFGTPVERRADLDIDGRRVRWFVSEDAGGAQPGELVASRNRLYDPGHWSLVRSDRLALPAGGQAAVLRIVSHGGRRRDLVAQRRLRKRPDGGVPAGLRAG